MKLKRFETRKPAVPLFPSQLDDTIPEGLDPITSEFVEYYAMKCGFYATAISAFTKTSDVAFMNFPLMNYIKFISPRTLLFIIGEKYTHAISAKMPAKLQPNPNSFILFPVQDTLMYTTGLI